MSWTTPPTFVSGNVLTAAQMNVLTNDLLETFTAKATGLLDLFTTAPYPVATGANALVGRQAVSAFITSGETTVNTTLSDLSSGTVGPTVTVTTGTLAMVFMNATVQNNTSGQAASIGFQISGATTSPATEIHISLLTAAANQQATLAGVRMATGLTAGTNTFSMEYVVGAGTGTFTRRYLTVMPF